MKTLTAAVALAFFALSGSAFAAEPAKAAAADKAKAAAPAASAAKAAASAAKPGQKEKKGGCFSPVLQRPAGAPGIARGEAAASPLRCACRHGRSWPVFRETGASSSFAGWSACG